MLEIKIKTQKFFRDNFDVIILLAMILVAVNIRMYTLSTETLVSQADPYFYLRHASEIIENNYKIPTWDSLSHGTPGRPFDKWSGWSYFIAIIYLTINMLGNYNLVFAANLAPLIITVFTGIFAYLIGKKMSNKYGGVMTSFLALFSPIIVSISVAGYSDTDSVVVFFSMLSLYTLIIAHEKKSFFAYAIAIICNVIFAWTWIAGFYVLLLYCAITGFNVVLKYLKKDFSGIKKDILFMLLILISVNSITQIIGAKNIMWFLMERFGWFTGKMLVNVSVAEMQKITKDDINTIINKVGIMQSVLGMVMFPLIIIYNSAKEKKFKLKTSEITLVFWLLLISVLLTQGLRFILLFSVPVIVCGGYAFGSLLEMALQKDKIIIVIILGFALLYAYSGISNAVEIAKYPPENENWLEAMEWIKENTDENSMIATWWDYGHLISYYGRTNHADGAHCPEYECQIYDHNDRIQDMGKILTTNNETEAKDILLKYKALSEEQCDDVKNTFKEKFNEKYCNKISDIYLLVSNDLVYKYIWLEYFAGNSYVLSDNNPGKCNTPEENMYVDCFWFYQFESQTNNSFTYSMSDSRDGNKFTLLLEEDNIYPFYMNEKIVENMVIYINGQGNIFSYGNETAIEKMPGLLWVQPDFSGAIYMPKRVSESIFVRSYFFNGDKMKDFEIVYANSEVKVLKLLT